MINIFCLGTLLWEIFSLGELPYLDLTDKNQLWRFLKDGNRLDMPNYSNDQIYEIMRDCWLEDTNERLNFDELLVRLDEM